MELEKLIHLTKHFSIAHHVQGRIRFKINRELMNDPIVKEISVFSDLLQTQINGFLTIRLNKAAFSLVIEYDSDKIPPATWEKLLQIPTHQEKLLLLQKFLGGSNVSES
ncbi:MAG: hypothetical protein H7A23_18595 [Leptospiraceae bacterium]|nr:hypothetical protein [Leptospiraceae bacterium]MCP5496561.1 hypothetical protein [Leptospiraceae bacterium]